MISTSNPNLWAAGVAQRLRIIQSNWADEESATRREYLREEVARSLDGLPSSERAACIEALKQHFPGGLDGVQAAAAAPAGERGPLSPAAACDQLLRLLKDASEEDKKAVCDRLHAAGITPPAGDDDGAGEAFDLVPEMIRRLRLKPGSTINSARAVRLLVHLLEAVLGIDDLVWNLWQQIAPNSPVRRKGRADLRQLVGSFLTNNPAVSFADVTESMELSRRVNTSLLGALGPLGRNFAKRHQEKFSPEAIREVVDLEGGGGFLKAKAVQCWQKYEDLAKDADEQAITLQLQEILSSYAEELILGARARQFTRPPFK
jgi:hypothetical protein